MSHSSHTFVSRLDLWADRDGRIHYVVPPLTYVTDETGRVFASPREHVHGRRTRDSFTMTVQSGVICDYCAERRRVAMGHVA
jgi:hypothetical protein